MGESSLVTMVLITYNQQRYVRNAVRGALAQTYTPLEIIISDDCSTDGTYDEIRRAVDGYNGPHHLIVNRNERNLGISGHLASMWPRVSGELVFIAAGDDVSVPERCARVVAFWNASERVPDLIATDLVELDASGILHDRITVDDLNRYRSLDMWYASPPKLFLGAAHAWSRRLMQAFGPLPAGTWEDHLMMFRAVLLGGAITLHEPLVRYRSGGRSRPGRSYSAATVAARLLANSRRSLVELPQMIRDAQSVGAGGTAARYCRPKLARETYIYRMLSARGRWRRLCIVFTRFDAAVPLALRIRVLVYAAFPTLLAPWFLVKRLFARLKLSPPAGVA